MTAETEFSDAPPRERALLPVEVRGLAMLAVAMSFGLVSGMVEDSSWATWASYLPKIAIALSVNVVLGLIQEKPTSAKGKWRTLRWRIVWYEAIPLSFTQVLFLSGLNAWKQENGWQNYFLFVALLLPLIFASGRLITKFGCPHCNQFFFDSREDSKASKKGNFLFFFFGMREWPNTHCRHCSWPLLKPLPPK